MTKLEPRYQEVIHQVQEFLRTQEEAFNRLTGNKRSIAPPIGEIPKFHFFSNNGPLKCHTLHECSCHFFFQGFITVRIWFPKLPGVVMMSDQEVIIMCKPVDQTVEKMTTAGFAGLL